MLEPRQSSGAPSEAPEASAASGREMRAAESLRLPLMRDDETDLLGFDDEGDVVGTPRRPWQSRRVIAAIAVVVVIAIILGGVVVARAAASAKPTTYSYATARQGTLILTVSGTGPVSAALYNLSFASSGRITAIDVQVGQQVTAGQTLAQLDTTSLQDALNQAQLQAYTAYDQEQQALNNCNNAKSPPPDCTQLAENQYASSLQQLQTAKDNLAAATLKASHAGVVTAINGSVGGTPGSGSGSSSSASGFIQLADSSSLQITTSVNEADISGVAAGQSATFTVAAYPGRTFVGTVSSISLVGATTSGVVTYPVTIQVDTSRLQGANLLTGMTATVTIVRTRQTNVLLIPASAVTFARAAATARTGGLSRSQLFSALSQARQSLASLEQQNPQITQENPTASWVVERSGNHWVVKPVALGLSNGTVYEVLSGLNAGDSIVIGEQNGPISSTSSTSAGTGTGLGGLGGFGGGRGGGGGGFGGGAGGAGGSNGSNGTSGGSRGG